MSINLDDTLVRAASSREWEKKIHLEPVWGTIVTFDIRGQNLDDNLNNTIAKVASFLHDVDAWFSTYRVDTPITAVRKGYMEENVAPRIVKQVLAECRQARTLTKGSFDPWCVPGGVDPSGYVKGWAADVAADMFISAGYDNVAVNASGDIACRGFQAPGEPWAVGIQHPENKNQIVKVVHTTNASIATSGRYVLGNHIVDPRTNAPAVSLDSATVIGSNGGLAEALATAFIVVGEEGTEFFADLPGWSAYLIKDGQASFFGPAFADDIITQTFVDPTLDKEKYNE